MNIACNCFTVISAKWNFLPDKTWMGGYKNDTHVLFVQLTE